MIQAYVDNATAQNDLVQGRISAIIIVPEDFSNSCNSFWSAPADPSLWTNTTLQMYVDAGSMFATQAITPIIQQVLATSVYGQQAKSVSTPIQISNPSLIQSSKTTAFEFMMPGIFAFASIFLTMIVAQSFTLDRDSGLLKRINVTPTTASEFMSSQAISNMIAALMQAVVVFAMAFAVGYRPKAGIDATRISFRPRAGLLPLQRGPRPDYCNACQVTGRRNWHRVHLHNASDVPWHFRRSIAVLVSTDSEQVRSKLLCHRRFDITLPERSTIGKPNSTVGRGSDDSLQRDHPNARDSSLQKIWKSLVN